MAFSYKKDTSGWEKLKKQLLSMDKTELQVGWFDTYYGSENSNLPHAFVAELNEFGHTNGPDAMIPGAQTPPRPFMRVGFREFIEKGRADQNFLAVIKTVISGQNVFKAMNQAGPYFVKHLQKVMDEWDTPPNARLTIELKGFNDPLNKTHQLIDKVDYRVERKGK
ncbi:MAG: hypothetical protein PUP93_06690 [Rhizonema sp. NSF051]|nr:hypothetical protein [Rhizonema sp. NSF051]